MTSAPVRPALWREEIDQPLVCIGVRQETHDVMSFTLRADEPTMLRFDPGQYVTLTAEIDGELLSRCYTIASAPTRPDSLTITVKRVPDGPVSNWLHDHVQTGTRLWVSGPQRTVQCIAAPREEVSLPVSRQWDHPADVDGAHLDRPCFDE